MSNVTPRERVEGALRWETPPVVPFTMYESMIPQCAAEREMRNRGMCIVRRDVPVFRTRRPDVRVITEEIRRDGRDMVRTVYETPHGPLTTLHEPAGFTSWYHERMFKSPEDYRRILFLLENEVYEPCYDVFAEAERQAGGDIIFRAGFGLEPLQTCISDVYIDTEAFAVEWMVNRDEILRLYEAVAANRRRIYPLVAASPALHANYGGNVTPEIIGLDTFERYYVQHYNEAAEIMHKHGKLIGCHFDANCRLLSGAIAATALDYIEAFTPAPDTDMSLADARAAWPGKVLWLNFPSSLHLRPDAEVEEATVRMVQELDAVNGLIVGITENIPDERWQGSCRSIMDGLQRDREARPALYAS